MDRKASLTWEINCSPLFAQELSNELIVTRDSQFPISFPLYPIILLFQNLSRDFSYLNNDEHRNIQKVVHWISKHRTQKKQNLTSWVFDRKNYRSKAHQNNKVEDLESKFQICALTFLSIYKLQFLIFLIFSM